MPADASYSAFKVPMGRHLLNRAVHHTRPLWRVAGRLESRILRRHLARQAIDRPVYVTGLARAGTTILLETLAAHPDVGTHQYRDFPLLFTPYAWTRFLDQYATDASTPTERAHADGITVTPHSPEAMEEVLWMAFFRDLHDPTRCHVLNGSTSHATFETFYTNHVRKLLLARGRSRYASKGNYNLTRLEYLLKLFPDARFVIPVRAPQTHIASLEKQHRLFTEATHAHPRAMAHLDQVGHFEFGPHRHAINPGDRDTVATIDALWASADPVERTRGWARYWAMLHRWLAARLEANAALRRATLLISYESLCARPAEVLAHVYDQCELPAAHSLVQRFAGTIAAPRYYEPHFSREQRTAIAEETESVDAHLRSLIDDPLHI